MWRISQRRLGLWYVGGIADFMLSKKTAIFIGYLNPLNAKLNDDITHFPQWVYIVPERKTRNLQSDRTEISE